MESELKHHGASLRQSGERIEHLLEELRASQDGAAWRRVDELVRLIVGLYGDALSRIVDLLGSDSTAAELRERLLQDELVNSLLLVHGLHPLDLETRVSRALERVRPYLGSHGGGVRLKEVDEAAGIARLILDGTCDGCPSSAITVKLALEGAIKEAAPEITRVEAEGVDLARPAVTIAGPPVKARAMESARSVDAERPGWIVLDNALPINSGEVVCVQMAGKHILLCRIGMQLYAYGAACPTCGNLIETARLETDLLTCPSCDQRYNLRLAGRSARAGFHLNPIPLLETDEQVKIAMPGAAS
jgi:Fe-S cluster biogenesis protein NfuA/nitrite reductase/ring-hydroxylating ferredoxin subunit